MPCFPLSLSSFHYFILLREERHSVLNTMDITARFPHITLLLFRTFDVWLSGHWKGVHRYPSIQGCGTKEYVPHLDIHFNEH